MSFGRGGGWQLRADSTDLLLVPPSGGTAVRLHSDPGQVGKLAFVSP